MGEHSDQVAVAKIDVRFHRQRRPKPGFKILQAQLAELRQHLLVSAVTNFDLRIVFPEFGQGFDDVRPQATIGSVVNEGPLIEVFFPMLFGPLEILVDLLDGVGGAQFIGA